MNANKELERKSNPLYRAAFHLSWIAGIAVAAILPFALTGCGHHAEEAPEDTTVQVRTAHPERRSLTREVLQPGYLRPYEMTPIYTKIAGYAKEPRYDIGDYVKKDSLMLELYVPEVVTDLEVKKARVKQAVADQKAAVEAEHAADATVDSAAADVDAKKATIESAKAQVDRWKAEVERSFVLLRKGVYDKQTADEQVNQLRSSEAYLDETRAKLVFSQANLRKAKANDFKAKADVEVANANVQVAEAARDQWADWLAYRNIIAPYKGVVTLRNVHTGHFLQPVNSGSTSKAAEPLFMIMRTDLLRCVVDVPELDSMLVKDGDVALVHFDAIPGVEFRGKVQRNSSSLDEKTRTLRVEVWMKNPTGAKVRYTADKVDGDNGGAILSVEPTPPIDPKTGRPAGGSGYPPNTIIPLVIAGGESDDGIGGVVNATTNSAGEVVHYTLYTKGSRYRRGPSPTDADTISSVLRPYMYAHVNILGKIDNAWAVPSDAVQSDILANNARSFVFVLEDGKARKMFVQVGARCAEGVWILRKQRLGSPNWEDVTGNEVVITTSVKALQDGQPVKIKGPEAK